jgi:urease accessory protein UreE
MVRCNPDITEEKVNELMSKYPRQCGALVRWSLGNSHAPAEGKTGANGTNESVRLKKLLKEVEQLKQMDAEKEQPRQRIVRTSPQTLD